MRSVSTRALLGGLLLGLAAGRPAVGQQAPADELKRDVEAMKKSLEAIQKDLQEIKGLLARQGGPRSAIGVVIDVASNPFKGEQTAALTLVEFSDYQ
jgi:hypothetical protein